MSVQLKRAGEDREKENKEFQSTVADQRPALAAKVTPLTRREAAARSRPPRAWPVSHGLLSTQLLQKNACQV